MKNSRRLLTTRSSRAFTLVEMSTSLVILSILLLACGSIVMMATRATSDGTTRNLSQMQSADAASQMTDDLNVALNFTQRTATATTFTVPDRLNLGTPQTITYSWDGIPGDPLMRQFNGGTNTVLLSGVQNFSLAFNCRLMGPAPGPAEQVLFSHATATGVAQDYNLTNNAWGSQYFLPSLPLGTNSFTVTRIVLRLKAGPQNGVMYVSLKTPNALFEPSSTLVAQATVYESALSNQYEWLNVPISGASGLNPLQPLCVVMTSATGSNNIGAVQVDQSLLSVASNAFWSTTNNAGSIWTIGTSTTTAMLYVYGTVP
jgi:prepilin-type N-terminal cleavage/methylation domain-containing protein